MIIKTCAFSASSVTEVKLPDSVNALEIWAFHNVVSLKTLVLSSNIKEINESVIHTNPNLERIVMSEGVQKLKQGSICNNAKLLCLILPSSLTDVDPKSVQLCPRIFYTHHLHKELIEMYCIGGFPRRSLLQPLKCTQSSSKISSSFIFSVLFVICSN